MCLHSRPPRLPPESDEIGIGRSGVGAIIVSVVSHDGRSFEMRETFDADGTLTLALIGELERMFCDEVETRLRGLQDAASGVRVDLAQPELLDSSGVRALLRGLDGRADTAAPWLSAGVTVPLSKLSNVLGLLGTSGQRNIG